jgi:FkbM family methyltransferase
MTNKGKTLSVFAEDSITKEIQIKGEYDGNTLDSLREVLAEIQPRVSLDIGANVGNHAVVIADYSKVLLAFEPVPFIYELLAQNLADNAILHARAINAGLSNENTFRDIFIPEFGNLGCSSLEPMSAEGTSVQIETLRGDDYLTQYYSDYHFDFIKMDVEGHEPAVLAGLENTLIKNQPLVLMEYRNQSTLTLFQNQSLFERFFPGYRIYSLSNTANKKVYPNGLIGFARRLRAKLKGRRWCLSDFDASRRYSNIYLVPERYQPLFSHFCYYPSK